MHRPPHAPEYNFIEPKWHKVRNAATRDRFP
jgi:hypothetical protein